MLRLLSVARILLTVYFVVACYWAEGCTMYSSKCRPKCPTKPMHALHRSGSSVYSQATGSQVGLELSTLISPVKSYHNTVLLPTCSAQVLVDYPNSQNGSWRHVLTALSEVFRHLHSLFQHHSLSLYTTLTAAVLLYPSASQALCLVCIKRLRRMVLYNRINI